MAEERRLFKSIHINMRKTQDLIQESEKDAVWLDTSLRESQKREKTRIIKMQRYIHEHAILATKLRITKNHTVWANTWIQTKVQTPRLNPWLSSSFAEAKTMIQEYVPINVWIDYWEKAYGFQHILNRLPRDKLQYIALAVEDFVIRTPELWYRSDEYAHASRIMDYPSKIGQLCWTREDSIAILGVYLSGLKRWGYSATALKFVKMVCILFRRR